MKLLQQPNLPETNILFAELSSYGLSPKDWILKKETKELYWIINKTEPDFSFKGETKISNGKRSWQSITLKSV